MLNIELINFHSNIFASINLSAILFIISPTLVLFILLALAAFNKYKNLVLGPPDLAIGNHITTNSSLTI